MSLFCLCIIENMEKQDEKSLYIPQIELLAKYYKCGVKYSIDWYEPILSYIKNNPLVINVLDCIESDNCDLFLLPDGWYYNGQTNKLTFKERMKFLQDISNIFINEKVSIDFYLGQSGTDLDEYINVSLKVDDLAEYLSKTVGTYGVENVLHISIIL